MPDKTDLKKAETFSESSQASDLGGLKTLILSMNKQISPYSPLLDKMNDDHVSQILDMMKNESNYDHIDRAKNRWFIVFIFSIIVAFVTFMVVFLIHNDKNLLGKIGDRLLYIIPSFLGGFGLKDLLRRTKKQ